MAFALYGTRDHGANQGQMVHYQGELSLWRDISNYINYMPFLSLQETQLCTDHHLLSTLCKRGQRASGVQASWPKMKHGTIVEAKRDCAGWERVRETMGDRVGLRRVSSNPETERRQDSARVFKCRMCVWIVCFFVWKRCFLFFELKQHLVTRRRSIRFHREMVIEWRRWHTRTGW